MKRLEIVTTTYFDNGRFEHTKVIIPLDNTTFETIKAQFHGGENQQNTIFAEYLFDNQKAAALLIEDNEEIVAGIFGMPDEETREQKLKV